MKPSGELFLEQTQSRRLGVGVKEETRRPRGREARPGGRRAPTLVAPPTYFFRLYILLYPNVVTRPQMACAAVHQCHPWISNADTHSTNGGFITE